ncbi:RNA methyltransferase [Paenibacillus sp. HB172176]|uniref:TrmH family RNA methyltransferase n=1 Tax=Paenibacillus sp. HB172176 TaxID=2493690 RepID=UPI00143BADB3|nr:RNA methyltransferase [Paenibacillus sp. HB172176]
MVHNHMLISSAQNERVKLWASLLEKKYRNRQKLFLVEGVHLIMEAVKAGAAVQIIVYDDEQGLPAELEDWAGATNAEWIRASKAVMTRCTDTDTPPPAFAVVSTLEMKKDALFKKNGLVIALDHVRDPGNIGTIIRSADAAGADAVILGKGCADLYNAKTVRSTMGSLFHLPIVEGDLLELLPEAREQGMRIVGTSLQATSTCYGYNWSQPTWLLMGNESNGLSQEVQALMDESVIIPIVGEAESLNVAMASTILMYEALRQRKYP